MRVRAIQVLGFIFFLLDMLSRDSDIFSLSLLSPPRLSLSFPRVRRSRELQFPFLPLFLFCSVVFWERRDSHISTEIERDRDSICGLQWSWELEEKTIKRRWLISLMVVWSRPDMHSMETEKKNNREWVNVFDRDTKAEERDHLRSGTENKFRFCCCLFPSEKWDERDK